MHIISKMNSHHISGLNQFVHLQKEKQRKERKEKKKIWRTPLKWQIRGYRFESLQRKTQGFLGHLCQLSGDSFH